MNISLAQLRELAQKATQGEWGTHSEYPYEVLGPIGDVAVCTARPDESEPGDQALADAAYIVAAQPMHVIYLLDRIKNLELQLSKTRLDDGTLMPPGFTGV